MFADVGFGRERYPIISDTLLDTLLILRVRRLSGVLSTIYVLLFQTFRRVEGNPKVGNHTRKRALRTRRCTRSLGCI